MGNGQDCMYPAGQCGDRFERQESGARRIPVQDTRVLGDCSERKKAGACSESRDPVGETDGACGVRRGPTQSCRGVGNGGLTVVSKELVYEAEGQ